MITCPFCGKPVHLSKDERDTNSHVVEETDDDYYCPTYVDVAEGRRWCHYYRKSKGAMHCAIIPPFEICWIKDSSLSVYQFIIHSDEDHSGRDFPIYQTGPVDFQTFLDIYHRFKNLKAFS